MELRHIRYFIRAAELLHFTHAAESLYISQPTLSTHIQQLEEEVGLPLFDRIGRNVRLTEAGRLFLEHAQRAQNDLDTAKERIADLKGLLSGTLNVGSLMSFGQEMLPSWIPSFNALYPKIKICVKMGSSDFVESELESGQADIGLSFVPTASEQLQSEILFTQEIFLVVGEHHKFAKKLEVTLSELGTTPLAMVSRQFAARRIYDAFLATHGVTPDVLVEMDDLQGLLKFTSLSGMATIMSSLAINNYPDLRAIPIVGKPLHIQYGVVWPAQGLLTPAARAFYHHVKEQSRLRQNAGRASIDSADSMDSADKVDSMNIALPRPERTK
jgi:LysR family transcriptional regulator, cyn operon transcriptional activator